MAAEGNSANDMQAHAKGYDFFIWLMKWGAVLSLITALIVILLIRN
jgi:hypothetical protein